MCNTILEGGLHRSRSKDRPRSWLHWPQEWSIAQGCGVRVRRSCYGRSEHSPPTEPSRVRSRSVDFCAKSNKYADLKPLIPRALEALKTLRPGAFVVVEPTI